MRAVVHAVSRNRRPHSEAKARKRTSGVIGIEKDRIDAWRAGGQRILGDRVNLRSVKTWPKQRVLVGRDEDPVGVSADVRIVTQAKSQVAMMVGSALGAIILDRKMINNPRSERARSCAARDVNVVVAIERRGRANAIESQRDMEPALGVAIEITTGIGDLRSVQAGSAINGGRIAIERIQIDNPSERTAGVVED